MEFDKIDKYPKPEFQREVSSILEKFTTATEWVDLSNLLEKLKKAFDTHKDSLTPMKQQLAKRLSQCLTPELDQIHMQVLEIYKMIFQREIDFSQKYIDQEAQLRGDEAMHESGVNDSKPVFGTDMGLFISNLYNFAHEAKSAVKKQLMELIYEKVLLFEKELLISLSSFLLCILPAMDDSKPESVAYLHKILKKTEEIVGTSKLFGEIWKTMLKSSRARFTAIKYLDLKVPKDVQEAAILNEEGQVITAPHRKSNIIASRYNVVIKEGKLSVEYISKNVSEEDYPEWYKCELELIEQIRAVKVVDRSGRRNSSMRNQQDDATRALRYFYYPDRPNLVVNALLTGLHAGRDFLTVRGTFDFLVSHIQIDQNFIDKEERIRLIEGALMTLVNTDFASLRKFFQWCFEHLGEDNVAEDDITVQSFVTAYMRILKRYGNQMHHFRKQEVLVEDDGEIHDTKKMTIPITVLQRVCDNEYLSDVMSLIIPRITVDLIAYIHNIYCDSSINGKQKEKFILAYQNFFEVIEHQHHIVWQALASALSEQIKDVRQKGKEFKIEAINLIKLCFEELMNPFKRKKGTYKKQGQQKIQDPSIKTLIEIIQSILTMSKDLIEKKNFTQATPALQLLIMMIPRLQNDPKQKSNSHFMLKPDSIEQFNNFFHEMCSHLTEQKGIRSTSPVLETFKLAGKILCMIQQYSKEEKFEEKPKWLTAIINCTENANKQQVQLIAVDILIQIIEQKDENNAIVKLHELISPKQVGFDENDQNAKVDICDQIIRKLWSMLDKPGDREQIVLLLKKFDELKPATFSKVITNDLKDANLETKRKAVEKFSIFWKLATVKDQKRVHHNDDEYMPFKPLIERNQKDQALGDDDKSRPYEALHRMLMILEDKDPTMRLSVRSWLQDSKNDYSRIIDPILKEMMRNNKMHRSFSGQLFFLDKYEADFVVENFTKLRYIILTTQEEFIKYIATKKYSSYVSDDYKRVKQMIDGHEEKEESKEPTEDQIAVIPAQGEDANANEEEQQEGEGNADQEQEKDSDDKETYVWLIVQLTLQFIMADFVECLDPSMYEQTQVVNASACEFMELFIQSISSYKNLCTEVLHKIVGQLHQTLQMAIENRNESRQVILINLMKVILFDNEELFYPEGQKSTKGEFTESAKNLFVDQNFFKCFIDGLKSQSAFVRYHYSQFIQKLIKLMSKVIEPKQLAVHIGKLIGTYSDILQSADVSSYESQERAGKKVLNAKDYEEDELAQLDMAQPSTSHQIMIPELKINQENDIIETIQGFLNVMGYCLGTKRKDLSKEEEEEFRQQLQNLGRAQLSDKGFFASIFGFFSSGSGETQPEMQEELKKTIFENSEQILTACLNCWTDFDLFRPREFFFTTLGVFQYQRQDTKDMQNKINEYYRKDIDAYRLEGEDKKLSPHEINRRKIKAFMESQFNKIQQSLMDLLEDFALKDPIALVKGFLRVWITYMKPNEKCDETEAMRNNSLCEKILQMILALQVPTDKVIFACCDFYRRQNTDRKEKEKQKGYKYTTEEKGEFESSLCLFVYSFLMHNISFISIQQSDNSTSVKDHEFNEAKLELYRHTFKFIDSMKRTIHPNTVLWHSEILHILTNKFPPPRIMVRESGLVGQMERILHELLEKSQGIIQREVREEGLIDYDEHQLLSVHLSPTVYELLRRFEYIQQKRALRDEDKETTNNEVYEEPEHENQFEQTEDMMAINERGEDPVYQTDNKNRKINLTFSEGQLAAFGDQIDAQKETIFYELQNDWCEKDEEEILLSGSTRDADSGINVVNQYMIELLSLMKTKVSINRSIKQHYSIFALVTLRQTLSALTEKVHSMEMSNHADAAKKRKFAESIIVTSVIELIQQRLLSVQQQETPSQRSFNPVEIELLTELLKAVTGAHKMIQQHFKASIESIFKSEGFFLMSVRSLRKWQTIMQQYLQKNDDLWFDTLNDYDRSFGIFTREEVRVNQKSRVFRQLSFLIFSTKKDQLKENLTDPLMKKMAESFKNVTTQQKTIRIELLLLSRILMLRLGQRRLTDALKRLWPHLVEQLVKVFEENQKTGTSLGSSELNSSQNQDYSLTKEAIKLVELMSQLNLDEFQMNQWMFLFNGFGIRLEKVAEDSENDEPRFSQNRFDPMTEKGEIFQPYLAQYMCLDQPFKLVSRNPYERRATHVHYRQFDNEQDDDEFTPKQFVVYDAYQTKDLVEEQDFSETVPVKLNKPLLKSDELKDNAQQQSRDFVREYTEKLQEKIELTNKTIMKLDEREADALIESDFLKKQARGE